MRSDIDHLPPIQMNELAKVKQVLMEEFSEAVSRSNIASRKFGKI